MSILSKIIALVTAATMLTGVNPGEAGSKLDEYTATQETANSGALTSPVDPVELCGRITVGWNLGNSLDATGSGMSSETSWGNPKTTKELILKVKEAGFDAVRIPTTWYNHLDSDFNISEEWIARVQEVVDYAYDEGMYVILNVHHENWNDPYESTLPDVKKKIKKLWTQIANRFESYGERLIFE